MSTALGLISTYIVDFSVFLQHEEDKKFAVLEQYPYFSAGIGLFRSVDLRRIF